MASSGWHNSDDASEERAILQGMYDYLTSFIGNRDDERATRSKSYLTSASLKLHPDSLDASDAWELLFRASRSLGLDFSKIVRKGTIYATTHHQES